MCLCKILLPSFAVILISQCSLSDTNISTFIDNSLFEPNSHSSSSDSESHVISVEANERATTIAAEDHSIVINASQQLYSNNSNEYQTEDQLDFKSKENRNISSKDNSKSFSIFNYENAFDWFNRFFKDEYDFSHPNTTLSLNEFSKIYDSKRAKSLEDSQPMASEDQSLVADISNIFPNRMTANTTNRLDSSRSRDDVFGNNITQTSVDESNYTESSNYYGLVSKVNDMMNESKRYCISSTDCDIGLNERCVKRNQEWLCDCKEPFFREMSSYKCQMKKLIRLLFKISTNHSKEVNNSIESIQLKHSIEATIWSVITNSSYLISTVDNIKAIELNNWRLVVDFYVKIADPSNDFHHKYIEYNFWYRLMSTIKGIDFKSQTNINLKSFNMRAIEVVNEIDYCSVKELNYCSDFAECADQPNSDIKFRCQCRPGLTDLSVNINYPGEVCALKCNTDLCGSGGVCEIVNQTQIHCICKNWNFGDRCQYSMNALLAIVSLIGLLSIFFSFCLTALYCGFKIHEEFVELRRMIRSPTNLNSSQGTSSVRII